MKNPKKEKIFNSPVSFKILVKQNYPLIRFCEKCGSKLFPSNKDVKCKKCVKEEVAIKSSTLPIAADAKLTHMVIPAEIKYGMIGFDQNEKSDFYSNLPERFDVIIYGRVLQSRTLGKRKIHLGSGIMSRFDPYQKITIYRKDNQLHIF